MRHRRCPHRISQLGRQHPTISFGLQDLGRTSPQRRLYYIFRERDTGFWRMDWRSLGGLPGGLGICGDGVVMQLLSGSSESWAPVGVLRPTARRLRGANGSQIDILGCSSCVVSFLGLRTEFSILVCNLSTDAIIGTDTLGSILPHTLDIKKGLLFTEGGVSLQLHRRDAALSGRVFMVGHCSIPPCSEAVLHCTTRTVGGRFLPSSGLLEGFTVFAENTGLVVGRTLVDPSGWRVSVMVSNFGPETVMVEPFSEIGMIDQVSAIQPVMDRLSRTSCDPSMFQRLLDLTSQDLDNFQRGQFSEYVAAICGFVPRARFCPDRSHGCSGTYHRHREQCTDPLCPSTDVASED